MTKSLNFIYYIQLLALRLRGGDGDGDGSGGGGDEAFFGIRRVKE